LIVTAIGKIADYLNRVGFVAVQCGTTHSPAPVTFARSVPLIIRFSSMGGEMTIKGPSLISAAFALIDRS